MRRLKEVNFVYYGDGSLFMISKRRTLCTIHDVEVLNGNIVEDVPSRANELYRHEKPLHEKLHVLHRRVPNDAYNLGTVLSVEDSAD